MGQSIKGKTAREKSRQAKLRGKNWQRQLNEIHVKGQDLAIGICLKFKGQVSFRDTCPLSWKEFVF